jgi:hypothetical protein
MKENKEKIIFNKFLYSLGLQGRSSIYTKSEDKRIKFFREYIINNNVLGFQELCKKYQDFLRK